MYLIKIMGYEGDKMVVDYYLVYATTITQAFNKAKKMFEKEYHIPREKLFAFDQTIY